MLFQFTLFTSIVVNSVCYVEIGNVHLEDGDNKFAPLHANRRDCECSLYKESVMWFAVDNQHSRYHSSSIN